jgi:hypothetical protein
VRNLLRVITLLTTAFVPIFLSFALSGCVLTGDCNKPCDTPGEVRYGFTCLCSKPLTHPAGVPPLSSQGHTITRLYYCKYADTDKDSGQSCEISVTAASCQEAEVAETNALLQSGNNPCKNCSSGSIDGNQVWNRHVEDKQLGPCFKNFSRAPDENILPVIAPSTYFSRLGKLMLPVTGDLIPVRITDNPNDCTTFKPEASISDSLKRLKASVASVKTGLLRKADLMGAFKASVDTCAREDTTISDGKFINKGFVCSLKAPITSFGEPIALKIDLPSILGGEWHPIEPEGSGTSVRFTDPKTSPSLSFEGGPQANKLNDLYGGTIYGASIDSTGAQIETETSCVMAPFEQ